MDHLHRIIFDITPNMIVAVISDASSQKEFVRPSLCSLADFQIRLLRLGNHYVKQSVEMFIDALLIFLFSAG